MSVGIIFPLIVCVAGVGLSWQSFEICLGQVCTKYIWDKCESRWIRCGVDVGLVRTKSGVGVGLVQTKCGVGVGLVRTKCGVG